MNKRILSMLLALLMVLTILPAQALATQAEETGHAGSMELPARVNPLYTNVLSVEDLELPENTAPTVDATVAVTYLSESDAIAAIRQKLVARSTSFNISVKSTRYLESQMNDWANDLLDASMVHTGKPNEGDYLDWQYGGWGGRVEWKTSGSTICATFTYNVDYYTTAAQENAVTQRINTVLDSMDLDYASDYRKVKKIYDYICANVTYDYANLNIDSYKLKYTAYAALMQGTAVCQGYALLFYRMALESGVDARFIAGDGGGGPHGWNIVKLGNKYYNLDTTWDAGKTYYDYFLRSPYTFGNHTRWEEYETSAFHSSYLMSYSDYVAPTVDDVDMISAKGHVTGNIVSWGAAPNAKLYQLFRRASNESSWSLVTNTGSTAYKDTTANAGVKYYYKVRGRNGDLMGTLDIPAVSCTRPAPATLANVTMTGAIGHSTGNIIYWNAVSGARFYQVYRLESGQTSWTLLTNTGSTGYKDELAKVGVRSYYKVVARNGDVISSMNINSVSAVRQAPTALKDVEMQSAQGHSTGIIVRWNPVGGATLYQVYRLQSGTSSWKLLTNTGSTGYKDTTAVPGIRYYYKVVARYGELKSSLNIDSVSAVRP